MTKHIPPSMETSKGHTHQNNINLKSTNTPDPNQQYEAPVEKIEQCINDVFANIIDPQQWIATYLNRRLPAT